MGFLISARCGKEISSILVGSFASLIFYSEPLRSVPRSFSRVAFNLSAFHSPFYATPLASSAPERRGVSGVPFPALFRLPCERGLGHAMPLAIE